MTPNGHPTPDLRSATAEEINEAMAQGVFQAIEEHARARRSIVVWEEGHVSLIATEDIVVPTVMREATTTSS